jgi:hypothetical protein
MIDPIWSPMNVERLPTIVASQMLLYAWFRANPAATVSNFPGMKRTVAKQQTTIRINGPRYG